MTMRDQIIILTNELNAKTRYINDLECRHDLAINSLGSLSSGQGIVVKKDESWDVSMKNLARIDLLRIAKMKLRVPA